MKKLASGFLITILLGIFLSGCGISPYRKEIRFMFNTFGGYHDTRMPNGNYYIIYRRGNGYLGNTEKVRDFALRRTCELTIQKGYKGFLISEERGDKNFHWFEVHLTDSTESDVINASQTLRSIHDKYR